MLRMNKGRRLSFAHRKSLSSPGISPAEGVIRATFVLGRGMSSSGRHRRAAHRGLHRKPSRTRQYVAYAGTTTAAGVIAAGVIAGPAGAAEVVPQQAAAAVHMNTEQLHFRHLRHLDHLAHMRRMRLERSWTPARASTEVVSAGIFSPAAIERLWDSVGGSPGEASTAACIAHFESGGNPRAISPSDDWGLMQINASWGPAMATLNPVANMEAAVKISDDGTNWGPWTTRFDCGV